MEEQRKVVVLPFDFTIDDVSALYCYLQVNACDISDVDVQFYTHEMIGQPVVDGVYLIDCGPKDYKLCGHGCTTAVVCHDFNVKPDNALLELIDLLTGNNQTGSLRKHNFSIPWAIRHLSQIDRNPRLVLEKALSVVDAYLRLKRTTKFHLDDAKALVVESDMLRKITEEMQEFLNEYKGGKQMDYHVFTLPWYIATRMLLEDLWTLIRDEARFWMRMFVAIQKKQEEAEQETVSSDTIQRFLFGNLDYFVAETGNPFVAEAAFRQGHDVVIIRNPEMSNVTIHTNKRKRIDLSEAARVLNAKDREVHHADVWYYNERTIAILNGSPRRPQPPTSLTLNEVVEIVKQKIVVVK